MNKTSNIEFHYRKQTISEASRKRQLVLHTLYTDGTESLKVKST